MNIFGGIVRCDLIAEGIIAAVKEVDVKIPVVVRLEGNNAQLGAEILDKSDLNVIAATQLNRCSKKNCGGSRLSTIPTDWIINVILISFDYKF